MWVKSAHNRQNVITGKNRFVAAMACQRIVVARDDINCQIVRNTALQQGGKIRRRADTRSTDGQDHLWLIAFRPEYLVFNRQPVRYIAGDILNKVAL